MRECWLVARYAMNDYSGKQVQVFLARTERIFIKLNSSISTQLESIKVLLGISSSWIEIPLSGRRRCQTGSELADEDENVSSS